MQLALSKRLIPSTQKIRQLCFQLLVSLLGAAIWMPFFYWISPQQTQQIVTVDVTGMIHRFVKTAADSKLPPEQLQKKVSAFGQALNHTLETVVRDPSFVLLPKEAVIAGAKDISHEVEAKIHTQLTMPDPSHPKF